MGCGWLRGATRIGPRGCWPTAASSDFSPASIGAKGMKDDLAIRIMALRAADPDAILVGRAAAAAWWWPELQVPTVEAVRRSAVAVAPGYGWSQRWIPPDHIVTVKGLRLTSPAVTVLDLLPELGGTAIDEALRRRAIALPALWAALVDLGPRPHNRMRRLLLDDSRDEPWSEAERAFHRILRGARLPWSWTTNKRISLAHGYIYLDAALPGLKLAFEVDGREHHGTPHAFVADRVRDVEAALAGWQVHRFAAITVADHPDWVRRAVERLAHLRARALGLSPRCDAPGAA